MARPKKVPDGMKYHPRVIINHTDPDLLLFAARAAQVMLAEGSKHDRYTFEEGVIVDCDKTKTSTINAMAYKVVPKEEPNDD